MSRKASEREQYRLETVGRACQVLRAFSDQEEALSFAELVQRTGLEKTIVFRIVRTLAAEGLLRKTEAKKYCSDVKLLNTKRIRIGYASQAENSFASVVSESLRWAAAKSGVDLVVVDNHYSPKAALRNAERLIAEQVGVAIEFQTYERVAPRISAMFERANIPMIAVEIPHPGATFFGIDNFKVGMLAGRALAKAAKQCWQGQADEVLLMELGIAGSLPHLRLAGAETAIQESLPHLARITHLNTRGEFSDSFEVVRRHLQHVPKRRTLIMGVNDFTVLGALRAFEEAGRQTCCVAVGLGAILEARKELRTPGTRLIGSIAFFPEQYGESLIRLALDILQRKSLPPAVYSPSQFITSRNVDQYYPQDKFKS